MISMKIDCAIAVMLNLLYLASHQSLCHRTWHSSKVFVTSYRGHHWLAAPLQQCPGDVGTGPSNGCSLSMEENAAI